jgi:tetratricopeptide (TPR) repeat protein
LEADRLIGYALADLDRCSSWIRLRVNMAAGDIALKEGRYKEALNRYEAAHAASTDHGGEGDGYQINPRLGMALINLGDLDEAERKFEAMQELKGIPIGNLYGDYGLALVAHKRGETQQAQTLVKKARQQLEERTGSNLLSTLLNELYEKLNDAAGEHARFEKANAGADAESSTPAPKKPPGSSDVEQPSQSRKA